MWPWSVAGAVPVLARLTVVAEPNVTWRLSVRAVASVLYLGVLAAGVGFVGFVWAALGESVTARQAAGALGVASGIWVVNTGR